MEHIKGEMRVVLLDHTRDAAQKLVFSKRTRHSVDTTAYAEVMSMSAEEIAQELKYVFSTIGSSWEFVDYHFLITGVTRAFTHQLVRHRVGVAFAQQAMRVGEQLDFGYMIPSEFANAIENFDDPYPEDGHAAKVDRRSEYTDGMDSISKHYSNLIKLGARPQDARGLLPTNILTNILVKVNLRALADMFNVRLCLRAQGEFQEVAREMQRLVLDVHPWATNILGPNCLIHGTCKFPRYENCPISQKFPELRGLSDHKRQAIKDEWESVAGYDPQPTVADWNLK